MQVQVRPADGAVDVVRDASENSDVFDGAVDAVRDASENSDVSDGAVDAARDASEISDASDGGDARDASDVFDVPDARDVTDVLDASDVPDARDVMDGFDARDVTDVLDVMSAPDVPDVMSAPDVPAAPDVADVPDVPVGCVEGAARCDSFSTLRTCTGGRELRTTCAAGCVDGGYAAFCRPLEPTQTLTGHVLYAGRRPDAARLAWGPLVNFYAQDFLVVSGFGARTQFLDVVRTRAGSSDPGAFSIRVRALPDETDFVWVIPAAWDARGLAYGVADPGFAPGPWPRDATSGAALTPTSPRLWTWRWFVDGLSDGGDLVIREEDGAGAAFVYDLLGIASRTMATRFASPMRTVVAWLGDEVESACGSVACYDDHAVATLGQRFDGTLWFSGTSANRSYYSASTAMHEIGHHVMASWGTPPHEGGPHYLGATSTPGLAWSEGFAHWFSSDVRGDSTHFDRLIVRSSGTPSVITLWKDLALRQWTSAGSPGVPLRARPGAGLLQPLDEDDIAAMLWSLSRTSSSPPFYAALEHPRMKTPGALYGYRSLGSGDLVPVFPDYLDTLQCLGVPAASVRSVTDPTRYYPYPDVVTAPHCTDQQAPFSIAWHRDAADAQGASLTARLTVNARIEAPITVRAGDVRDTVRATQPGQVFTWRVRVSAGARVRAVAEADGGWWRVRAESEGP